MLGLNTKLQGEYKFVRRKITGEIVEELGPFKNLITNEGMDALGTQSGSKAINITRCFVGSSNTPPEFTDTTLGNRVATAALRSSYYAISHSPSYHVSLINTYRFEPGVAEGNLTEVGVGYAASAGRPGGSLSLLFSRALTVDSVGNPTTITVLPDEYLDVTYTLRFFVSQSISAPYDIVDSATGITHTLRSRLCNDADARTNSTGLLLPSSLQAPAIFYTQAAAGVPVQFTSTSAGDFVGTGHGFTASPGILTPYIPGTYYTEIEATLGLSEGNSGAGIAAILSSWSSGSNMCSIRTGVLISPPIAKTPTKVLRIKWKISWSR